MSYTERLWCNCVLDIWLQDIALPWATMAQTIDHQEDVNVNA